jgi:hypothetical protein
MKLKDPTHGAGPVALCVLIASLILTFCAGCGTTKSIVSSKIAHDTVTAVARHYGGANAGELASAGLYATADVLQGYVDKKPPLEVAANSPGVAGVSQIVVSYLKRKGFVTQKTIDNLHAAAEIAAHATVSTVNEGP